MKASFDATGETLIVTGGARGLGAAVARAYVEAGGTAVVLDVAPTTDLARADRLEVEQVDVSDRAAVVAAVDAAVARHGRVDALVAGAAVQPRATLAAMDPDEWRHTIAVNVDGVVWAAQAVLAHMRPARRGAILAYASGLALQGRAEASAYAASKGALIPLVKSLAAEVAADGIRVNVVFPGVIDTEQFRAANVGDEREHWAATTGIGVPEDVVGPLMFLLSDAATMTGSTLTRERAFPATEDRR